MQKNRLKKYAHLIATMGVSVQKGQEVFIAADLDQPEFVKMLTEECYKAGAKRVVVDFNYAPLSKLHAKYRSQKNLNTLSNWEEARWQHYVDEIPCRIYLDSEDPDGLKGIRQDKLVKAHQAQYKTIRTYRDQIENKYQWCIAAVPGEKWAKKLFPKLSKKQAVEKLWEAILTASRVGSKPDDDPCLEWKKHNADLEQRCAYLNSLNIETLEYHSSNGTDFTVGMIPEAEFKGGGEWSLEQIFFNPNIPSEEVFISPMRGKAEGIVYSTKPLSYQSELIDHFSLRFHEGKVTEVHAEVGENILKQLVQMDEGASFLGECALVAYDSPIQNSGLLFMNTLFDENAACHLALGRGYADTIRNYQNYSLDECRKMGLNDSMIHVDFMIGSEDLSITAHTRDGKTVAIFKNGNWAF